MLKRVIYDVKIIQKRKIYAFVLCVSFSLVCLYTIYIYALSSESSLIDEYSYFPLTNYNMRLSNSLIIYLIPLFSSIITVDLPSIQKEMEVPIFTRITKEKVYFSNLIAGFICGFGIMFLIIVSIYLIALAAKNYSITYFTEQSVVNLLNPSAYYSSHIPFEYLLLNYQWLYHMMYIFILSLYSGLMAALGYSIALFFKKRYMISLYLFLGTMLFMFFPVVFHNGFATWYPQNLFLPKSLIATHTGILTNEVGVICWIIALILLPIILVLIKSRQEEL